MTISSVLWRALRLRCPQCGRGRIFRGWFATNARCDQCGLRFERGPGYWLGSIYVNYGLTALLVTAAYFSLYFSGAVPPQLLLWSLAAFCFLFPLWFFRYARSIWLAMDVYFDPAPDRDKR